MASTERRYRAPAYAPASQGAWHHFLFGHVPGWQLDFIVQPELRGTVQRHHLAALRPLFAKLDPRAFDAPCYAIGNLSLYQDEEGPGRGALAILYGQRFGNLSDHAGRPGAFFCHAAVVAGRNLQPQALATAIRQFELVTQAQTSQFFQQYYSMGSVEQDGQIKPRGEDPCVMDYLRCFAGLENLPPAPSKPEILLPDNAENRPSRVLIICQPQQTRERKLSLMAELATVLFHSHVPWVWITLDVLTSVSQQSEMEPKQLVIHLIPQALCPTSIQESLDSNTLVVQFEHPSPVQSRVTAWLTTGREATTHTTNGPTGRRPKDRLSDSRWRWPLLGLALLVVALLGLLVWSLHRPSEPVRKPALINNLHRGDSQVSSPIATSVAITPPEGSPPPGITGIVGSTPPVVAGSTQTTLLPRSPGEPFHGKTSPNPGGDKPKTVKGREARLAVPKGAGGNLPPRKKCDENTSLQPYLNFRTELSNAGLKEQFVKCKKLLDDDFETRLEASCKQGLVDEKTINAAFQLAGSGFNDEQCVQRMLSLLPRNPK